MWRGMNRLEALSCLRLVGKGLMGRVDDVGSSGSFLDGDSWPAFEGWAAVAIGGKQARADVGTDFDTMGDGDCVFNAGLFTGGRGLVRGRRVTDTAAVVAPEPALTGADSSNGTLALTLSGTMRVAFVGGRRKRVLACLDAVSRAF